MYSLTSKRDILKLPSVLDVLNPTKVESVRSNATTVAFASAVSAESATVPVTAKRCACAEPHMNRARKISEEPIVEYNLNKPAMIVRSLTMPRKLPVQRKHVHGAMADVLPSGQ